MNTTNVPKATSTNNVVLPRFHRPRSDRNVKVSSSWAISVSGAGETFSISPLSAFTPFKESKKMMDTDTTIMSNNDDSLEEELISYMEMSSDDLVDEQDKKEYSRTRIRPSDPVGKTLTLLSILENQCRFGQSGSDFSLVHVNELSSF